MPAVSDPRPRRALRCAPNGLPTSRRRGDQREGEPPAHSPRWDVAGARAPSQSGAGRGASSRQRCQTRRAISSASRSASERNSGSSSSRCATTGANSSSTSSGSAWSRPCTSAHAAGRALEREAAAHRRAERDELDLARRTDQRNDPALHDRVDVDVIDRLLQLEHVCDRDDRPQRIERMPAALVLHDPQLLVLVRIPERRAQEEAVELGLGQRKGALLLDRVLGRDQEERRGQGTRRAVDRDLTLRHRLEQRRLRLRHRPVDLVDEQHVARRRGPGGTRTGVLGGPRSRAPSHPSAGCPACTARGSSARPRSSLRARGPAPSSPCPARPRAGRDRHRRARSARSGSARACRSRPSPRSRAGARRPRSPARGVPRSPAPSPGSGVVHAGTLDAGTGELGRKEPLTTGMRDRITPRIG